MAVSGSLPYECQAVPTLAAAAPGTAGLSHLSAAPAAARARSARVAAARTAFMATYIFTGQQGCKAEGVSRGGVGPAQGGSRLLLLLLLLLRGHRLQPLRLCRQAEAGRVWREKGGGCDVGAAGQHACRAATLAGARRGECAGRPAVMDCGHHRACMHAALLSACRC